MKKIMMLGANFFQMTAIKRAKELGYYVITADYLPKNPGHQYADESYNVSTLDKEAILELASSLKIDGILSYASDVSAPTAAYVAEKLGLPTNPYRSVLVLTRKHLFRQFMNEEKLQVPQGQVFHDKEQARIYFHTMNLPVMIKPVDASGSKGVIKVQNREDFESAYEEAMSYSFEKSVIIETFIEKKGYQIDGDGFIKDGKIVFFGVMDQHNNTGRNPHAPIGLSYPSIQKASYQKKACEMIQTIFDRLDMRFGAFNFEYIVDKDENVHILEIGPRNGGNFIPDTLQYALGVDLVEASIRACVGDEYGEALVAEKQLAASSYVIHSLKTGTFKRLSIHSQVKENIVKKELFITEGDPVKAFRNGGDSIGAMVLAFENADRMNHMMDRMWEYVEVIAE